MAFLRKWNYCLLNIIESEHNGWSIYWISILFKRYLLSVEPFDQLKQRWLLHKVCLVCTELPCSAITGGVCSGSLQANQKPQREKTKAYPLCMENYESAPCECSVGESWTLTGRLSSREITPIHTQKLHWDIDESSVLYLSISICCTWWNFNFHFLINPIIGQWDRHCRIYL